MSGWYWLLWAVLTTFNAAVLWAAMAQTKRNLALLAKARAALDAARALMGEDTAAHP